MAKTNLSLSGLYQAWTGTARSGVSSSLNAANNMAGTAVSMSSFAFDSLAITQPFTYIVENTSENVVVAFTTQGLAFDNRVKNIAANYTITVNDNTSPVNEMGVDFDWGITVAFLRDDLVTANVHPEVGDIILYQESYFEIDNTNETQYFMGKTPDYPYSSNPLNPGLENFELLLNNFE